MKNCVHVCRRAQLKIVVLMLTQIIRAAVRARLTKVPVVARDQEAVLALEVVRVAVVDQVVVLDQAAVRAPAVDLVPDQAAVRAPAVVQSRGREVVADLVAEVAVVPTAVPVAVQVPMTNITQQL